MPIFGEIWKDIPGYEGLYQASNLGRIRSLRKWRSSRMGRYYKDGRVLKQHPNRFGYMQVALHKNGSQITKRVGKLVLLTFVGPPPAGCETRHFPDRDITNNRLCNLSWADHTTNIRDRFYHGTHSIGVKNPSAKLTETDVVWIRELCKKDAILYAHDRSLRGRKYPYGRNKRLSAQLYETTGKLVTATMIGYIIRESNWKHLI